MTKKHRERIESFDRQILVQLLCRHMKKQGTDDFTLVIQEALSASGYSFKSLINSNDVNLFAEIFELDCMDGKDARRIPKGGHGGMKNENHNSRTNPKSYETFRKAR